jgi:uncharacterized protein YqjF (DUF2071 family)
VTGTFLTAEWRYLAMLNYRVSPSLLFPLVPPGTELDLWNGTAYISVVGFKFQRTRIFGVPIPFHINFEEVNLRFYVRREVNGEVRRGVTFIRELVPRAAIAGVARVAYNEPYVALSMRHHIRESGTSDAPVHVEYQWARLNGWAGLRLTTEGRKQVLRANSEEEFITQHYWGYTRQKDGSSIEYEVRHPHWNVWKAQSASIDSKAIDAFPPQFSEALSRAPDSALLADGSPVTVHRPTPI